MAAIYTILNKKILKQLQANARLSHVEIGRQVGISSPAVTERVRKMEDAGIIKGYRAEVSPFDCGYQLKAIITLRAFMGKLKPFLEKVKTFDEVVNCYRITGNENIVLFIYSLKYIHIEETILLLSVRVWPYLMIWIGGMKGLEERSRALSQKILS